MELQGVVETFPVPGLYANRMEQGKQSKAGGEMLQDRVLFQFPLFVVLSGQDDLLLRQLVDGGLVGHKHIFGGAAVQAPGKEPCLPDPGKVQQENAGVEIIHVQRPFPEKPPAVIVQNSGQFGVSQILMVELRQVAPAQYVRIQVQQSVRQFRDSVGIEPQHTAGGEPGAHVGLWQIGKYQVRNIEPGNAALGTALLHILLQGSERVLGNGAVVLTLPAEPGGEDIDLQGFPLVFQKG